MRKFAIVTAMLAISVLVVVAVASASTEPVVADDDAEVLMPAWLEDSVRSCIASYGLEPQAETTEPTQVKWSLATVAEYSACLPEQEQPSVATVDAEVYVVVVDGVFGGKRTAPMMPAPVGTQLLLVHDAETHELAIVGVLKDPFQLEKLEQVNLSVL